MKAIVISGKEASVVTDRPVPKPRPDQILVKTSYIALNPTDWKHITYGLAADNCLSGCDYSGIVEAVGSEVTKPFSKGDQVCGVTHGGNFSNPNDGAFAEKIVVKGDVQMHIPATLSPAQAATFPLGAITCGQGLFQKSLKLNLPTDPTTSGDYVLVYGGSTATGSLAVQYAKLAGYNVLATCSPRHNEWMKTIGVTAFDYNAPDCAEQIKKHTNNSLKYAFDTISSPESAQICADALSTEPGLERRYGSLLEVELPRKDVISTSTLMYTIFDEDFQIMGQTFPRSTEDYEFAKEFFAMTEKLIAEGKLKTHPEKVKEGGLEGALQGMEDMKAGKVSGEKLVYKL